MYVAKKINSKGVKLAIIATVAAILAVAVALIFIFVLKNKLPAITDPSSDNVSSVNSETSAFSSSEITLLPNRMRRELNFR